MRRSLFIILILCCTVCANICSVAANPAEVEKTAVNSEESTDLSIKEDPILPSIFIWQMPEEEVAEEPVEDNIYGYDDSPQEENSYGYVDDLYVANYDSTELKGYLEYVDDSDTIGLKNTDNSLVLNLQVPQNFKSKKVYKNDLKLPNTTFSRNIYGRSSDLQYNIAPLDFSTELKHGGFSVGTSYNESIDYADFGFTASFYTKYENKYFALSTSYDKNGWASYSEMVDKFSVSPELKLNKHISIRDVISSDITRNRRKNELILSIKPTNDDRVRFEFGAGQTYDANSVLLRSQVKFSTHYKW